MKNLPLQDSFGGSTKPVMRFLITALLGVLAASTVYASGALGVYAVVEDVVFEPNREDATHIRIYGAFALVDQRNGEASTTTPVRGYLYFRRPGTDRDLVIREWADIADTAGTGQGIAFGQYGYFGRFDELAIDIESLRADPVATFLQGSFANDALGVRPLDESPASPAIYQPSDTGVVLLGPNHEAIVDELRALIED